MTVDELRDRLNKMSESGLGASMVSYASISGDDSDTFISYEISEVVPGEDRSVVWLSAVEIF